MRGRILFNDVDYIFISNMPNLLGNEWDDKNKLDYTIWNRGDKDKIKSIKKFIKDELTILQNNCCAYCGMPLGVTSEAQIEHIAPKGAGRYPRYMFHSANLVLSCSLCNGFKKKERRPFWNTISKLGTNYSNHKFNIVHPYFDDPKDHYELEKNGVPKVVITHKTLKGQKSIVMLELDNEIFTTERGKLLMHNLYIINPNFQKAFTEACNFIPNS